MRLLWWFVAFTCAACEKSMIGLSKYSTQIINSAAADGIDILSLPFGAAALASIDAIQVPIQFKFPERAAFGSRIDTHVHVIPDWYRALVPLSGQSPTPAWDVATHFQFMVNNSISHGIVSISSPGSTVFPGNQTLSIGLARLLNEWVAALVKTYPKQFSFYAVAPLPYTEPAIKEVEYALDSLKAIGVGILSNHEGYYPGNFLFTPFYRALNNRNASKGVIFIHPNDPRMHVCGSLIIANPTLYPTGFVEFYFETARAAMDLAATQTLQNFTNLNFVLAHVGGSFPSIIDRFESVFQSIRAGAEAAYKTRLWYDSAGPTYPRQVAGLLAYGIPTTQLTFGTDFPYARGYELSIAGLVNTTYLSPKEKVGIFSGNVKTLFGLRF